MNKSRLMISAIIAIILSLIATLGAAQQNTSIRVYASFLGGIAKKVFGDPEERKIREYVKEYKKFMSIHKKALDKYNNGDYKEALKLWKPIADKGYLPAQYNIGLMYQYGQGVPKNSYNAVKWYTLSAEKGFAKGQKALGLMYITGNGVPENKKNALKWFTLSSEQGLADAQYFLGVMYEGGYGIAKDYTKALQWFLLAAYQNHSESQSKLDDLKKSKSITSKQFEEAQRLARECVKKEYKGC